MRLPDGHFVRLPRVAVNLVDYHWEYAPHFMLLEKKKWPKTVKIIGKSFINIKPQEMCFFKFKNFKKIDRSNRSIYYPRFDTWRMYHPRLTKMQFYQVLWFLKKSFNFLIPKLIQINGQKSSSGPWTSFILDGSGFILSRMNKVKEF